MDETRRKILSRLPLGAAVLIAGASSAAPPAKKSTQSLTMALSNFAPGIGGFVGTLTISNFAVLNGLLSAVGTLSGNVLNGSGGTAGSVSQAVAVPAQVAASCEILTLTLGPLDLNLLGLVIHLNQVVLTITAVPGAGNLLGNLLCAIANLLNNPPGTLAGLLAQLVALLNQILAGL
jgi:hypothetical protein